MPQRAGNAATTRGAWRPVVPRISAAVHVSTAPRLTRAATTPRSRRRRRPMFRRVPATAGCSRRATKHFWTTTATQDPNSSAARDPTAKACPAATRKRHRPSRHSRRRRCPLQIRPKFQALRPAAIRARVQLPRRRLCRALPLAQRRTFAAPIPAAETWALQQASAARDPAVCSWTAATTRRPRRRPNSAAPSRAAGPRA